MDKLKELLKASKPTSKLIDQKKIKEEQNKKYELQHKEELLKQQQSKEQRLKEVEEFY